MKYIIGHGTDGQHLEIGNKWSPVFFFIITTYLYLINMYYNDFNEAAVARFGNKN